MRNIKEEQITSADAKAILNKAAEFRNTPSGLGKMFKGLRKDKIDVSDLQNAWKNHTPNPYPDDTEDITAILKDQGFSDKEIKKVYTEVFGADEDDKDSPGDPVASATIQKIANYAIQNNIKDDLILFLEKQYEFKESVLYNGKLVIEDIRQVFTRIVDEDRTERPKLLKDLDRQQLGRTRK